MFILTIVCVKIQQFLPELHLAPSKLVHLTLLPTTSRYHTTKSEYLSNTCLNPPEISLTFILSTSEELQMVCSKI